MVTLTQAEMERLDDVGRVSLFLATDGVLYWDFAAHSQGDEMIAGLSDAWDDDAGCFPDTFTFERTVGNE